MALLRLEALTLAFGHHRLLDGASLEIEAGERVCLIGRNGEGKSSLLRIACGTQLPDEGRVVLRPGGRVAYLEQEARTDLAGSVFGVVAAGLAEAGALLTAYHEAVAQAGQGDETALDRMAKLQQRIEQTDGWRVEQRVQAVLTRLGLDGSVPFQSLSGGWRRRALLGRALVQEPDVLLLDEPTNHLDLEAITWLEQFLENYQGALLFVTHDRAFLQRLATRIVELDRGQLASWPGSYQDYVRRKEEQRAVEAEHNALFDRKLSQEEAWIRQGIQARRTRNEGRVRALEALRRERQQRREGPGRAALQLDSGTASGKLVFEAQAAAFAYGTIPIIRPFSARIQRGDRIGIVGPNGAGKSTLLRLLLGELAPTEGTVRAGTRIQAAYFDQQRAQLNPEATVMDSVGEGKLTVSINGKTQHVAGYLRNFLFPAERLRSPVRMLSGGERNRLLLARLFAQPANVLVMDEPTNDLDIETLELLEEVLIDYDGTVLLVSHDRAFLDRVVTSILVLAPGGTIEEFTGGYSDWLAHQARTVVPAPARTPPPAALAGNAAMRARARRLSYREQAELAELPQKIEALEHAEAVLLERIGAPDFYQQAQTEVDQVLARLAQTAAERAACYARWEALERDAQALS
ncbi:MAG TPA: ATP-binding cassette domain-containing protein [Acidiferrobacteraceae bacterium]|nr:ATP-binding cassette domain-containing protein [Acidiferrobacteraceae bacterium]